MNIHSNDIREGWRPLAEFEVPSQLGNERQAIEKVVQATAGLGLGEVTMERLKTAVGEATMNAMEYGNQFKANIPARLEVLSKAGRLLVRVVDQGGDKPIIEKPAPDLDAKLAGEQSPRGWGLFLIKNMVDDVNVSTDGKQHIVELFFNLEKETL